MLAMQVGDVKWQVGDVKRLAMQVGGGDNRKSCHLRRSLYKGNFIGEILQNH